MFLVVNPNKHVYSILITNKFKYNKTWKIPSNEAQDFPCLIQKKREKVELF